ncbi:MAG: putative endonuclease 4 [Planctomycetaceae bacterium]|nr:MAG: putative endonuclease 4 [Planctomycetaceae bacterium]
MPLLGAHMSIAGGYYKAAAAAAALSMDTVQLFTKSNNQWRAKPLTSAEISKFRETVQQAGLQCPCAHTSYLINLASTRDELWQKSVDALVVEVERAEALGLVGLVLHPGSAVDAPVSLALQQVVKGLNEVHTRTDGVQVQIWLETTAGQGSSLGYQFEQLAYILNHVRDSHRLGVCFDTCHVFAAGYPIGTVEQYTDTWDLFERVIGVSRLRAFHLNDSQKPAGSRVDRHQHIGRGHLGLEPFRWLLNDPRFAHLPMYLETPKGEHEGDDWDAINLRTLRNLMQPTPSGTAPVP